MLCIGWHIRSIIQGDRENVTGCQMKTNWFFMKVFFSVRSWISFKEDEVWWLAMTGDGCKKWICKWRCYDTSFLCLIRTAVLALVLTFDFNVIQEGWWMPSQDRLYNSSWWQPTTRRFQRQPLILKPREWEIRRYREEIGHLKAPGLIQRTQNSTVISVISICLWNSLELLGSFARETLNLVFKHTTKYDEIDIYRSNMIQHWKLRAIWSPGDPQSLEAPADVFYLHGTMEGFGNRASINRYDQDGNCKFEMQY